ncbi:LysE family translocator [Neomicrococcus lactis]|uniref:LysE family translocator n=1 Tax=Neomicrococcus lactis TaxID=732241 RepID=UPI00230171AE|nr:LysE family translocator [Neomicrococcus lactis]
MPLSTLSTFWVVSTLMVLTPGADWAYTISSGLKNKSVVPAISGMLTDYMAVTVIVASGVGVLVAANPQALTALTVIGCAYLVWLGVGILRHPATPEIGDASDSPSIFRQYVKGFGVSGLNPKVMLLYLALIPQFTIPTANIPVPWQIVLLGLIHITSTAIVYLSVGYSAKRVLGARPSLALFISRLSGVLMIAIAALMIFQRFVV